MKFSYMSGMNPTQINKMYLSYMQDRDSIDEEWIKFFEGFEFAVKNIKSLSGHVLNAKVENIPSNFDESTIKVLKLIDEYRRKGHFLADVNPVSNGEINKDIDLSLKSLGLNGLEDKGFDFGFLVPFRGTLKNIELELKRKYTGTVGFEIMHCSDEIRDFILEEIELKDRVVYSKDDKKKLFENVLKTTTFEHFLHTRYVGKKRFSIEGVDSLVVILNHMMDQSGKYGVKDWLVGMPHRGRLSTLVNVFDKPYSEIFTEFEELKIDNKTGDGDVKYHLGRLTTKKDLEGNEYQIEMPYNPSHLETVSSIAMGMARAKIDRMHSRDEKKVVPILIHGDAAVAGQGIVYETLNMAYVESTKVGGAIHIIANNQVGFTANVEESRSSMYCSDIAKTLNAPIFHVNADDIEKVAWVGELGLKLRQKFGIEVFIDLIGFRRYGHNEGDEPRFTQPLLYKEIDKHEVVSHSYGNILVNTGVLTQDDLEKQEALLVEEMQKQFDIVKSGKAFYTAFQKNSFWKDIKEVSENEMNKPLETAIDKNYFDKIVQALKVVPEKMDSYKKYQRIIKQRIKQIEEDSFDWSMGEMFAYGSLLLDGYHVRINGEDAQRGTFSHRQSMVIDVLNEKRYFPLKHIDGKQGEFDIYNSILSEYGALGFEYGYANVSPNTLTIWEAQFGDFANGAQIIFDQYISAAESKWNLPNGLVTLLPHGQEGQGPEHSSARLERYLQLSAEGNMFVTNVTTPANLFHMLRRQILSDYRKPLIAMTPKSLLRHPLARSKSSDFFSEGFKTIIDDEKVKKVEVKKIFFCSGKVYYSALEERERRNRKDVAFIRLEQLYPLDKKNLNKIISGYNNKKIEYHWLQEEPENMGSWWYIYMNMRTEMDLKLISRKSSASPAVGKNNKHNAEMKELFDRVFV